MRNKMGSNPIVVVAFKTDQQLFFEDFYAENKRGGFESHSTRWALMFGVVDKIHNTVDTNKLQLEP